MAFRRKFKVPRRQHKVDGDYHRPCDRCAWEGWLRSELQREEQTELLVCKPCLDVRIPQRDPNTIDTFDGKQVID